MKVLRCFGAIVAIFINVVSVGCIFSESAGDEDTTPESVGTTHQHVFYAYRAFQNFEYESVRYLMQEGEMHCLEHQLRDVIPNEISVTGNWANETGIPISVSETLKNVLDFSFYLQRDHDPGFLVSLFRGDGEDTPLFHAICVDQDSASPLYRGNEYWENLRLRSSSDIAEVLRDSVFWGEAPEYQSDLVYAIGATLRGIYQSQRSTNYDEAVLYTNCYQQSGNRDLRKYVPVFVVAGGNDSPGYADQIQQMGNNSAKILGISIDNRVDDEHGWDHLHNRAIVVGWHAIEGEGNVNYPLVGDCLSANSDDRTLKSELLALTMLHEIAHSFSDLSERPCEDDIGDEHCQSGSTTCLMLEEFSASCTGTICSDCWYRLAGYQHDRQHYRWPQDRTPYGL